MPAVDVRTGAGAVARRGTAVAFAGVSRAPTGRAATLAACGVVAALLLHTTAEMKVNCEEVFAPLVTVTPYRTLTDAIAWVNASPYGLQAGVFTTNLQTMFRLHAELDVGAVNGNDIPGFRVDRLPYGGAKASGLGREGVRYAIEEMTERRVLTLKLD